MRKDVNVWAGKTVSSVADGYEAFVLAQIVNAKKLVLYIASDGVSLAQTAAMLRFCIRNMKFWNFRRGIRCRMTEFHQTARF